MKTIKPASRACESFEPEVRRDQIEARSRNQAEKEKKPSQREMLINSASSDVLWQDSEGTAYATVSLEGGSDAHYEVRGSGYRKLLSSRLYQQTNCGASKQAIEEALCTLEARAQNDGLVDEPALRSAFKNGKVYFDSGNAQHAVYEISSEGWRQIKCPPVKFLQPPSMRPAVDPLEGATAADFDHYLSLLNIEPDSRLMESVWSVQAILGQGPYPIKVENAPQGSGKSTRFRAQKRLLDPSKSELRSEPKDEADLFIGAKNNHLNMFDNMSTITNPISDGMCKLATGAAFNTRKFYSNTEEIVISACRPLALNGITEFASRPDLLDRAVFIKATRPARRKSEVELWKEINALQPKLLGFLFNAVAFYLKNVEQIRSTKSDLARMADFHITGSTVETFFGYESGDFDRAYERNHSHTNDIALESNPIGSLIREHIDAIVGTRSSTKLLELLRQECSEADRKLLPRNSKVFSDQLKRIKFPLEACGISFQVGKSNGWRFITISKNEGTQGEHRDD